jgi:hypothetical protein
MVDIVFTAVTDDESPEEDVAPDIGTSAVATEATKSPFEFTDSALLQAKRIDILSSLAARENSNFLQKTRAQYWDPSHELRVVCSISKRYEGKPYPYWYAYHPQWDEFLAGGERNFFVLGCMDLDEAFAIPREALQPILTKLNQTKRETGSYWHIHLAEGGDGLAIVIPGDQAFSLKNWAFPVSS